jgi:NADPH2:quinone reductase
MHAIEVREHGGPEVLRATELDDPTPGEGELLVRVAASGVNFIDTYKRSGLYPTPTPFVPGEEGAGEVVATGDGVTGFAVGDRVAWTGAMGSYAQLATIPAAAAIAVPAELDDQLAAAALLQGMTAHYLTTASYPVQPGDTVLVHAAAGGTGLLVTQLARARGGRVIGTVSTAAKQELARAAGADEVIRYTEVSDLAARVRELTGGDGVAAVYDGVGAATFEASLASLRRRGTLVVFGASSGPVPALDPQRLNAAGSVFLTRPKLGDHVATREELAARAGEVLDAVRTGALTLRIGATYPLDDARRAHEDLQSRRTTGKLLLLP